MARYSVYYLRSVAEELENLPRKRDRQRVVRRIMALGDDPRPTGSQKLAGLGEKYRLRQGAYRIIYEIDNDEPSVTVVKIGHRKDVYR